MAIKSKRAVRIPAGGEYISGDLVLPKPCIGIVLFAHGSGSSRHSSRNQYVAHELNRRSLGTLLIDLLTEAEEQEELHSRRLRFDIGLLGERLRGATKWLESDTETAPYPIGYFGASTGAAAALVAAVHFPNKVNAVVSRGGRSDLAADALQHVVAPTLLLVGSLDLTVIELNEQAFTKLQCEKELVIVPGATHLFEEPGTLEAVAALAADWFVRHMG